MKVRRTKKKEEKIPTVFSQPWVCTATTVANSSGIFIIGTGKIKERESWEPKEMFD